MTDQLLSVMKYAVMGTVVGVATGKVGDLVNSQISVLFAPTGMETQATGIGRLAFQVVVSASLAGVMIYAGDQVMSAIGPDEADPLFRLFYTQIAFHTMGTANMSASATRRLLDFVTSGVNAKPEPMYQGQPPSTAAPGCGAGCGRK